MKTEADLAESYPDIFELWHKEPDEIDGPTPQISVYGFQHGDGWNTIIESLCDTIDNTSADVTVVQQKQKFGGLRFYHNGINADTEREQYTVLGAIRQAQTMSFYICEQCGASAELRDEGWYRTLCDECWSAEQSRRRKS